MSTTSPPPGVIVHEIRWSDALPWWILFRAAGAAFSPTVILLAALGALATWAGWSVADRLGVVAVDPVAGIVARARTDESLTLPLPSGGLPATGAVTVGGRVATWGRQIAGGLPAVVTELLRLMAVPFRPAATLGEMGGALARLGWFVLVWSIFGTGISRHVALRLVGEEAPGLVGATLYGSRKWLAAFNAVLFVLLGIAVLSIPGTLLGFAMRTDAGLAVAGVLWPLVLAGAILLTILALGVAAGWPLMVATVGVERGDSFQAISTAFSYLYQRPLHYAFYGLVALVVAVPALAVAGLFADLSGTFAIWATSFGMGHERTAELLRGLAASTAAAEPWGVRAIGFWSRGVEALLSSFGWGYFWAIATAAYVLLRRDVDGTELDEVVIEEPGSGNG